MEGGAIYYVKSNFFGTTSLLFDDGNDQVLFDAHFTRPSLVKYIAGAKVETNRLLCDKLIGLHHIDRLRAIFISHCIWKSAGAYDILSYVRRTFAVIGYEVRSLSVDLNTCRR